MSYSITTPKNYQANQVLKKIIFSSINTGLILTIALSVLIPNISNAKSNGNKYKQCTISSVRPEDSKWILKNKIVSEGVRYTTDVYQSNDTNGKFVEFSYLLKDSTSKAENKVVANFNLTYRLKNDNWNATFSGCSPKANKNDDALMVSVYNDQTMLKSIKMGNKQKTKSIGIVRKPNANHIRVMNIQDITKTK